MTVKDRILTISLMEKMEKNPVYAEKIGLTKNIKKIDNSLLTCTTRAGVGSNARR